MHWHPMQSRITIALIANADGSDKLNYAKMTVYISHLLKKNDKWSWNANFQRSFEGIKQSLMQSPILAIADQDSL